MHIVPLLCAHDPELGNSVQAAVDAALAQVQPAIDDFEAAAAELLEFAASMAGDGDDDDDDDDDDGQASVKQDTEAFVKGCRHIITGNVDWRCVLRFSFLLCFGKRGKTVRSFPS